MRSTMVSIATRDADIRYLAGRLCIGRPWTLGDSGSGLERVDGGHRVCRSRIRRGQDVA